MNILKSHYSELESLVRYLPNIDCPSDKHLFRGVYLTTKMTQMQEMQWKEILGRQRACDDGETFLFNLLVTCQNKNRSNLLLANMNFKGKKLSKSIFQSDEYVSQNSIISHICLSNLWIKRRHLLSDDALIYLCSELTLIECLNRKRQMFIQLTGTCDTFYSLPYYIARKTEEKERADQRGKKLNTRKRTIQFHLHSTKQGQQAHLTDLHDVLIARNMMDYHVSRFERFDIHHPIEQMSNGQTLTDAMFSSEFSQTFFHHRPKQEVEQIRENLIPIFERFRSNHHQFYLRRRSRLPLSYTNHHIPEPTASLDQLISLTTPVSTVQNFVRIWLERVVPVQFLGCQSNHHLFIRKMCFLIQLPRAQQYSLGDAIRNVRFRKCQWTKTSITSSSIVRQLYVCHLIYFLVQYVLVLIRSYFYVTEGSSPSHPLVLVFYRHKIWHAIQQKARRELIEKSCAPTVEREVLKQSEEIRYLWKVRFVPKTTSIRYLACATEQLNSKDNLNHLKYANEILKYLRRHNPHLMGISALNRTEMHRRWQDYCRTAPEIESDNRIYFLRSDVSSFYDSINLDYLDKALVEFLDNCQFNYNLYIHTMYKTQYRNGRLIRRRTIYWLGKENEQMCEMMTENTKRINNGAFHDMIIHDGHVEMYDKIKLLKYIRAQIFNSHLYTRYHAAYPVKTYRRTIGINHGLRIASVLGQIYLNQIDQDIDFSPLADEFAVRHEDDLLIVSPHRYRLRRLKLHMTKKLNDLHHLNNPLKTKTNIRHRTMAKLRPVEYWGSLVDIRSREILVSINLKETPPVQINHLTMKTTRETGCHLRYSLLNALCLRAHSYYFDRMYTSDSSLIKNFYLLSCYFLKRLHSMCFRFVQFYSKEYVRSKSLFLFRTMRSALHFLLEKAFISSQKRPMKLIQQCKYVFFLACVRLARQNKDLFQNDIISKRFSHMMRKLKHLNRKRKADLKRMIGVGRSDGIRR